jgi:hypothetical protein
VLGAFEPSVLPSGTVKWGVRGGAGPGIGHRRWKIEDEYGKAVVAFYFLPSAFRFSWWGPSGGCKRYTATTCMGVRDYEFLSATFAATKRNGRATKLQKGRSRRMGSVACPGGCVRVGQAKEIVVRCRQPAWLIPLVPTGPLRKVAPNSKCQMIRPQSPSDLCPSAPLGS